MLTVLKILVKIWGIALMGLAVYSGYKIAEFLFMTNHPSGLSSFSIVLYGILALVDITMFFGGFVLLVKKLKKQ